MLARSLLTRSQSMRDFKNTCLQIEILGTLNPNDSEKDSPEWSEVPSGGLTTDSTTPGTSVNSKSKQLPSWWVGSLISWEHPNTLAKSSAANPCRVLIDLSQSLWWALKSPTKIKADLRSFSCFFHAYPNSLFIGLTQVHNLRCVDSFIKD